MERKTVEDICKYVYKFDNGQGAKSIDIASALNLSKSTVSLLLKKLQEEGYVEKSKYGKISLTEKGEKIAKELVFKHRVVETFLDRIGVTDIHKKACALEHSFDNETIEKLYLFLGKPSKDPHGKVIEWIY